MDSHLIPLSKTGKHAGKYTAIVSPEDADLSEFNWRVQIRTNNLRYAARMSYANSKATPVRLHRVILERILGRPLEKYEFPDHIDGDGLNNTRPNLRLATRTQNMANTAKRQNNKFGLKGAMWDKARKSWYSMIYSNRKRNWLGFFKSPIEAHRAYCIAAVKYHGEFANFGEGSPFTPEMFTTQEKAA